MKEKSILFFFCIFLLISCTQNFKLLSSIKQTVYPGIHSEKKYTNYLLKFSVTNDTKLAIDSIKVFQKEKCFKTKHLLKLEKSASYIKEITKKGNYILEIPLKKRFILKSFDCNSSKEKIIIYYTKNNHSDKKIITKFAQEKKRRR